MSVLESIEETVAEESEGHLAERKSDPTIIVTIILSVLTVVVVGVGIFVRVQYNIMLEEVEQSVLELLKPKTEKTWSA